MPVSWLAACLPCPRELGACGQASRLASWLEGCTQCPPLPAPPPGSLLCRVCLLAPAWRVRGGGRRGLVVSCCVLGGRGQRWALPRAEVLVWQWQLLAFRPLLVPACLGHSFHGSADERQPDCWGGGVTLGHGGGRGSGGGGGIWPPQGLGGAPPLLVGSAATENPGVPEVLRGMFRVITVL